MSKRDIERLLQDLQSVPPDKSLLEHSLEQIIQNARLPLGQVIRLCAIPHWFTPEVIGVLRCDAQAAVTDSALFGEIVGFAFVQMNADGSATYHEEVRNLLLRWWRQEEHMTLYREASQRLSTYFSAACGVEEVVKQLHTEKRPAQDEWTVGLLCTIETIYHALVADEEDGIKQLLELFWALDYADEYAACHYLTEVALEHEPVLSEESRLWLCYLQARSAVNAKEEDRAVDLLQDLLNVTEGRSVRSAVLVEWGRILDKRGHPLEAEEFYLEALQIAQQLGDERAAARALGSLGDIHADRGLFEQAGGYYEYALDMDRKRGDKMREAHHLRELGGIWRRCCRWQASEVCYYRCRELAEEVGNQAQVGWALRDLGLLATARGQWDESLTWFNHALAVFEALSQSGNRIAVWENIGDVNRSATRWDEAEAAYRRGLDLSRQIGDRVKEAWRLNDLGLLAGDRERWDEALEWFEQALGIFEELNLPRNQITVWGNIGDVNRSATRWDEAERAYRQGLDLSRQIGDRVNEAWRLSGLGLLAGDRERWDEALEWFEQAIAVFIELDQPHNTAWVVRSIAVTHLEANYLAQAETAFLQSLRFFQSVGDSTEASVTLDRLAELNQQQGRWKDALSSYRQAVIAYDRAWGARYRLGLLLISEGAPDEATPFFEECLVGLPEDILGARVGLALVSLYTGADDSMERFREAYVLARDARERRTVPAHILNAFQVVIDFGLGHTESARERLAQMLTEHWQVWDRIERRTAIFALHLLAQSPYPLKDQKRLTESLREIKG